MFRRYRFALLLILAAVSTLAGAWPKYRYTDLGSAPSQTIGWAINNNGDVAVRAEVAVELERGGLWQGDIFTLLDNVPPGNAVVFAINDFGVIGGYWNYQLNGANPFLYKDGVCTTLETVGPQRSGMVYGLNNLGLAVGHCTGRAVMWVDTVPSFLPTPPGTSWARDVNNTNVIVGQLRPEGETHFQAFRYAGGQFSFLANAPGGSDATSVNDAGVIVGYGTLSPGTSYVPLMWRNGTMTVLPHPPVPGGYFAFSINNYDQVVGCLQRDTQEMTAVLWDNGEYVELDTIVPERGNWHLTHARAINDDGQITGYALDQDHTYRAFLLTPIPELSGLSVSPSTVIGGNPATGKLTLTAGGTAGGVEVALTSSDPAVASVPATITVPHHSRTFTFPVTTASVAVDKTVTIIATYEGKSKAAFLTVESNKVARLTLSPNPATGGKGVTGTLTLVAGPTNHNVVVTLASSNTSAATVPTSVTIPANTASKTFAITTKLVGVQTPVNITATSGGASDVEVLTLLPLKLFAFTLSSNTAVEGQTVTATITLTDSALSGGAVVTLTNSNPAACTVPASITVPQGSATKTFPIVAKTALSSLSTTITASRSGVSLPRILTVTPIQMQSFDLTNYAVVGGTSVNGVIFIPVPAPTGGYKITLTNSNPAAATVPATVTTPAGAKSVTFAVATKPVSGTAFVAITAKRGNSLLSRQLQVSPPEVKTFTISPLSVRGGTAINGTVTLTGKAPVGGLSVSIQANPSLASPATEVRVPVGATSLTFRLNTSTVTASTPVNVSARTFTVTKWALLTLTR